MANLLTEYLCNNLGTLQEFNNTYCTVHSRFHNRAPYKWRPRQIPMNLSIAARGDLPVTYAHTTHVSAAIRIGALEINSQGIMNVVFHPADMKTFPNDGKKKTGKDRSGICDTKAKIYLRTQDMQEGSREATVQGCEQG